MQGRNLPALHFLIIHFNVSSYVLKKRMWRNLKPVFRQSLPVFPAACR